MSTTDKHTDRILKLSQSLFDNPENQKIFSETLKNGDSGFKLNILTDRTLPTKTSYQKLPKEWQDTWRFTENSSSELSYSLDCSSLFMIAPLIEVISTLKNPPRVCDLCSSPGGKSILMQIIKEPEILIANEVEEQRVKALISNFSKHQIKNAVITSLNSKQLVKDYLAAFDIIILDAPCSGQSLLSKGTKNFSALSKIAIERLSQIQKGLLNDAAKLCNHQAFINYSTCTFTKKENEKVIEWFIKKNPKFSTVEISHLANFKSDFTKHHCYRLWPYQGLGSGGFCCLLKKDTVENDTEGGLKNDLNYTQLKKHALWQSICSFT